ncbi:MAG TPA: hypothetical protein VKC53_01255 [Patescibacteria group bacterium]|nr:hypothetical protein [Patescibacteria group bacterium]
MKYVITIILTALVVGLGVTAYFKGWLPSVTFNKPQAVSVQNTEVSNITLKPTTEPSASPSSSFTKVKAGGVLVFKAYSLDLPALWTSTTSGTVAGQIDKLTLVSGKYKIVFTQAALGGEGCVYPGDADQAMSIKFNAFSSVTTSDGAKLRVGLLPSGNRTVCEMQNGAWGDLTEFGRIDITNPSTPDQTMLDQINSILSSVTKI